MIAITIRKLVVRFGDTLALDHVDLRVEPGELLLLLGPSGCGKTTLLRALAGFAMPEQGAVLFGEEDVTRLAPHRRNTGMVFQTFALWPHLDVRENVAFGLRERKVDSREIDRRVREALDAVGMPQHATRRIDQLSGGEQQRIALARALVVRPRCLLLDEPLSNLDATLRHSMRDEIRRVCKEFRLTAVYVTHDQKEALAIADRIAVMKEGRILQVGTPFEVYRTPVSRAVATFVGETNLFEGTVIDADDGYVRVRTSIGDLTALRQRPGPTNAPDRVWVSVRPECVSLARADAPPPVINAVPGELASSTYLGDIAEHRFRIGSELLRVHEQNPRATGPTMAKSTVALIAPDDVVLLPFDGPGIRS